MSLGEKNPLPNRGLEPEPVLRLAFHDHTHQRFSVGRSTNSVVLIVHNYVRMNVGVGVNMGVRVDGGCECGRGCTNGCGFGENAGVGADVECGGRCGGDCGYECIIQ